MMQLALYIQEFKSANSRLQHNNQIIYELS
jgi:hypothetical protein